TSVSSDDRPDYASADSFWPNFRSVPFMSRSILLRCWKTMTMPMITIAAAHQPDTIPKNDSTTTVNGPMIAVRIDPRETYRVRHTTKTTSAPNRTNHGNNATD